LSRWRLLLEVEIAVEIALHHRHTILKGEVQDAATALGVSTAPVGFGTPGSG
jgi:hypothetical protein